MPIAPKLLEGPRLVADSKHLDVPVKHWDNAPPCLVHEADPQADRPAVLRLVRSSHHWCGGRFNGLVLEQKDR